MSKQDVNETTQFLEGIFTVDHSGIVIVDHNGIILRINPAFTKILGYETHEILGKPFYLLAYKNQKMQKITSHNSLHRFYCSENASMEMTLFDRQGHDIPVRFRSVLIRDKHDQIKQAIGIIEHMVELTGTSEQESSLAEKMWEAQQNFDNLLNNSVDAIIICDITGNIMMANKAFSQMLDYSQEEVTGKHVVEFTAFEKGTFITSTGEKAIIDEEYVTYTASRSAELFEKGSVSSWESHLVKKDKVHIPVEITMSVLKDIDGERRGSLIILRDITERKKAEKELIETRNFLEEVFNTTADGIMVTDSQGGIVRINKAIEQMLGFREDELIGKYTVELGTQSEESKKANAVMLEQLFEKGFIKNYESEWYRKDKSLCLVETSITFIKDNAGNLSGSVGAIRDITTRKGIEEEHIRLSSAVEQTTDTVMIMGPDGTLQYINPATESFLGYSREEVIGQNIFQTERGIYDKKFYQGIQETISKGKVWTGHITYKRKDASLCEFKMTISPIRDKSGKIINFVAIGRDVTNELKLEQQLQQAKKMEAIGTLAGGVAHDLNNVLSGILSYPELLLLDLPQDSPLRKPILTMQRSGEKAAAIVQDMLTLARRGVAITEVINLNDVVSDYLSSPEFEKLKSFHPNIRFETNHERDLLNILGSPVHLSKTVMNLVSNATEAVVGEGEVKISTTNQYVDKAIKGYDNVKEGDYTIFKISDTGIGISSKDIEKIFEPFYTKKTMGRSGTGLGMSVVWATVKDHKGYIDVQSVEGKGTTFTLYFPVTRKELAKDNSLLSIEDYMGKGETILVVDDVEEQRVIATTILTKLGYSVTTVSSGEEAVTYMKDNSADLLVLDMIMDPGIDGLETYKNILETHQGQKAIITSGFSETDRVKEAKQIGVGTYVKKPYALEKIGVAIKTELENQS
jgi:PAS domain S-box-containing protein